jgi:hypothetical protein
VEATPGFSIVRPKWALRNRPAVVGISNSASGDSIDVIILSTGSVNYEKNLPRSGKFVCRYS